MTNNVEVLLNVSISELKSFKDKLDQRSYFKNTSIDKRIGEIKAVRSTLDAIIHMLKTGKGLSQVQYSEGSAD